MNIKEALKIGAEFCKHYEECVNCPNTDNDHYKCIVGGKYPTSWIFCHIEDTDKVIEKAIELRSILDTDNGAWVSLSNFPDTKELRAAWVGKKLRCKYQGWVRFEEMTVNKLDCHLSTYLVHAAMVDLNGMPKTNKDHTETGKTILRGYEYVKGMAPGTVIKHNEYGSPWMVVTSCLNSVRLTSIGGCSLEFTRGLKCDESFNSKNCDVVYPPEAAQ